MEILAARSSRAPRSDFLARVAENEGTTPARLPSIEAEVVFRAGVVLPRECLLYAYRKAPIVGGAGEDGRSPSDMLSLFEYLAVIVSVVIGLGLTRILQGVGELLEARAQVQLYWVHLVFTGIVFLGHLLFWWLFWSSREVEAWSFFPFLFLLLQPIILYLLAGLCFPDFSETGPIDFKAFYYRNHRWFFGLFALLMVLISLRDILFRSVPWISQGNAVKAGVLLIAVVGAISSRPWIHAILALLGAIAMVAAFFTFGLAYGQ